MSWVLSLGVSEVGAPAAAGTLSTAGTSDARTPAAGHRRGDAAASAGVVAARSDTAVTTEGGYLPGQLGGVLRPRMQWGVAVR